MPGIEQLVARLGPPIKVGPEHQAILRCLARRHVIRTARDREQVRAVLPVLDMWPRDSRDLLEAHVARRLTGNGSAWTW